MAPLNGGVFFYGLNMAIQDKTLSGAEHDWFATRSGMPSNAPLDEHKRAYWASLGITGANKPFTQMEREWLQKLTGVSSKRLPDMWIEAVAGAGKTPTLSIPGNKFIYFTQVSDFSLVIDPNNAVTFDGSTQYGTVAADTAIQSISSDFTVEGWFWKNSTGGTYECAWQVADGGTQKAILQTENATPSLGCNFSTRYSGSPNADGFAAGGVFLSTAWSHVAYVFNTADNKTHIYKDGSEISYNLQQTGSGSFVTFASGDLAVGRRVDNSGNKWNGRMACLRIWSAARTPTQIADNKDYYLDPTRETGLIANWNFNQGSGTSIANTAPGGTALALTGTPTWSSGPTLALKSY